MTKQEAIEKTGYTENELVTVALDFIKNHYKKLRNNYDEDPYFTIEDYDHYDGLVAAYDAIIQERKQLA